MNDEICTDHAERIAVLESKIDTIGHSIDRMVSLLEPMIALYKVGKFALWLIGAALSFTHWDQLIAWLTGPPKH